MAKPNTFVRIPKERVGVLIGPDGQTKKHIEQTLLVKLTVESEDGGVTIDLTEKADDPLLLFKTKDVVTAIGRGFSPQHAFRLIRDETALLDMIDLRTVFGKSESDIKRVKGRIIGMNGKTRRLIEELTETNLAIFGHTVSIIGTFEQVGYAREAVQMLVRGSLHSTVYRFLNRARRELKKKSLELWEKPPAEAK